MRFHQISTLNVTLISMEILFLSTSPIFEASEFFNLLVYLSYNTHG